MHPVQEILCPTDFSASSERALDCGIALARLYGASIRIVHVMEPPVLFGAEVSSPDLMTEAIKAQREYAETKLTHAQEQCNIAGVVATTQLEIGYPSSIVADLSNIVDLIVMATRGRTGLPHLALGSVAERVVRAAKCPVMVVPPSSAS